MMSRTRLGGWFARRRAGLAFRGNRFTYLQAERLRDVHIASGAGWGIVRLAIPPLLAAAVLVAALCTGPALYGRLAAALSWPAVRLPQPPVESYTALLGTVAQAAAAMLALFFAALSLVASTSYAKITSDIRTLVAQDDLNRRYLQLLAHTGAVAMAGLGLHAAGLGGFTLLAWYVLAAAAVGVLAFLPLGVRTFALFDPSALTGYPTRRFFRVLPTVTFKGRYWRHPAFQQHASQTAEQQFRLLTDIVALGIAEDRPRQTVVLKTALAVNRLARYSLAWKAHIPSESLWFARRADFKRWELASSAVTGIALNTGVAPSPDAVPDHSFVETRCTDMTIRCLRHLFKHDAVEEAAELLLAVNATATHAASNLEQNDAMQIVAAARTVLLSELTRDRPFDSPTQSLHLVDVLCVASLAPILATPQALTVPSMEKQLGLSRALLRLDYRGTYADTHPRPVLSAAEDLLARLTFELEAEGSIRTQPWYVRQVVAGAYADSIRDAIEGVVATLQQEFLAPASTLAKSQHVLPAALWLQRTIEASHKAAHQIESLHARHEELRTQHITEAPWHPSGAERALASVEFCRVTAIRALAALVPDLCTTPAGGHLPDLVGQARARIADELIAMMTRKENTGFAELFAAYFDASMAVYRHFAEFSKQPGRKDYIRVSQDVALDMLDVSGLAYLFCELDGTAFAKDVAADWDSYFSGAPNPAGALRAWYSVIDSRRALPVFSPSAMQRQAWGQRLARAMTDRGVYLDRRFGGGWHDDERVAHPSPVIDSIIVSHGHPMQHPHEYFGALYLAARPEAKDVPPAREVANCIRSIRRAAARKKEAEHETTDGQPEV